MLIANSITKKHTILTKTNQLLGNDIEYDWINYATTVGVDYLFSLATNRPREYDIPMQEHQLLYDIELLRPSYAKFERVQDTLEDQNR